MIEAVIRKPVHKSDQVLAQGTAERALAAVWFTMVYENIPHQNVGPFGQMRIPSGIQSTSSENPSPSLALIYVSRASTDPTISKTMVGHFKRFHRSFVIQDTSHSRPSVMR